VLDISHWVFEQAFLVQAPPYMEGCIAAFPKAQLVGARASPMLVAPFSASLQMQKRNQYTRVHIKTVHIISSYYHIVISSYHQQIPANALRVLLQQAVHKDQIYFVVKRGGTAKPHHQVGPEPH